MLSNEKILEILKEANVLLQGHFLLTSGKHSDKYLQCAKLFRNSKYSELLCKELAEKFVDCNVDVVIGPAYGAMIMSYEVSRHLNVENFFTERDNGVMVLKRGFEITKGLRCLIVEDVVTTGGSVKEVIKIVEDAGGEIVGIGSIVDRTGGKMDFSYPYKAVLSMEVESFEADECPICKKGEIPLVKPGSRNIQK